MADGDKRVPVGASLFGGGSKGGAGLTEEPNTLRSRQIAKIIDLLGEGPIQGLAKPGLQSVIFDTIAVQNVDGTFNYQGANIEYRTGTPNQTVLTGFPSTQEEMPVGVQLKTTTPFTFRVDNPDVNRVRITVRVPSLNKTGPKGKVIEGEKVQLSIYRQLGGAGGYKLFTQNIIQGKTMGPYQRAITIPLPAGADPWDIRIVRDTPDSKDIKIQNDSYIDSYALLTDARIRYRNSAVVGISVDAEQFSSIPTRLYDVMGLLIQVPVNYDPVNATYNGVWNGTFKTAWSNNPAWVFYNLCTQARYGLGEFITSALTDKWGLYAIGQWCDERVPDGKGSNERRWVCNAIVTDRQEAYDLLQSLASIFRGSHYWAGGQLTAVADRPLDYVGVYSNANVENGDFTYQGSDRRARHTQAAVAWSDPDNLGQRRISLVEDADGIQRYGLNRTDVVAIGCTSEGQAHRIGKWTLYTELNETETVSFSVGLNGAWCRPGDIIAISDITISGERRGGRTIDGTTSVLTLDASVTFHQASSAFVSCLISGKVETREVAVAALETPTNVLTLLGPTVFSAPVGRDQIWVLTTGDLKPTLWRVINIEEGDNYTYRITGMAHDPGKYLFIERNIIIADRDISNRPNFTIANLTAVEELVQLSAISVGTIVTLSWMSSAAAFDVDYRRAGSNWTRVRTIEQVLEIPVQAGTYNFKVTPIDMAGFRGKPATLDYTVSGLAGLPADVLRFRIQINGNIAMFTWAPHPDLDVQVGGWFEIRYSPSTDTNWTSANPVLMAVPGTATTVELPNRPGTYLIKAKDSSGIYSKNAAVIVSNKPDTDAKNAFRITEHPLTPGGPGWQGTMIGTEVFNPLTDAWLVLGQTGGAWDDQLDPMDTWPNVDVLQVVVPPDLDFGEDQVGTYDFFNRIDLGGVFTTVLTVDMLAFPYFATSDFVDDRPGTVDEWQDWDSMDDDASGQVMIRLSQTDVNPSIAVPEDWSPYQPFVSGEYIGRAFRFQAVLVAPQGQQVAIENLAVTADFRAKQDHGNDVPYGTPYGAKTVTFAVKFYLPPAISIQLQDGVTGDKVKITAKSNLGFTVQFLDASNATIVTPRTWDWQAQGY